jgi:toxin ParE1/3/4
VASFTRTARAEEDLIDIWTYVASDNPAAADRLLDRIQGICGQLAENPKMGPARSDLAENLRYFVMGSYLLLYREVPRGAEIVRVVHGARHLPDLFGDT